MLFILDIIISLTKVTVWKRAVIPSCRLIAKGVNAESKPSHAANDIMGEVKHHVFGKTIRRMHNQGPFSRRSAPLLTHEHTHTGIHYSYTLYALKRKMKNCVGRGNSTYIN
eukprot:402626-Pelagomonas_calceolata.AAC.1